MFAFLGVAYILVAAGGSTGSAYACVHSGADAGAPHGAGSTDSHSRHDRSTDDESHDECDCATACCTASGPAGPAGPHDLGEFAIDGESVVGTFVESMLIPTGQHRLPYPNAPPHS